jgi:hypothetical protein
MRSLPFQAALGEFIEAAAELLRADIAAGAEVPFELEPRTRRGGSTSAALYCYHALTGEFIAERQPAIQGLPGYARVAKLLAGFDGLERYLASAGVDPGRTGGRTRVPLVINALLEDVFREQTDFELRPERMQAALQRLEQSALAGTNELTIVATLRGLMIASLDVDLAKGLKIAMPGALEGLPEGATTAAGGRAADPDHLVVVLAVEDDDARAARARGRALLKDLLRALRLFGDGRVSLGALAWIQVAGGAWQAVALGTGGRPQGMLLVTAEQEDELRAFCNLVSRRAPDGNELAWALRRFELGCERDSPYDALSDHLLALRALLEPEGPASGLLAGRLAALCAPPGQRVGLTERTTQALGLERAVIAGSARPDAAGETLCKELSDNLRALLRDVICGHLSPDLAALADEILLAPEPESGEQMIGDSRESEEILDLLL